MSLYSLRLLILRLAMSIRALKARESAVSYGLRRLAQPFLLNIRMHAQLMAQERLAS